MIAREGLAAAQEGNGAAGYGDTAGDGNVIGEPEDKGAFTTPPPGEFIWSMAAVKSAPLLIWSSVAPSAKAAAGNRVKTSSKHNMKPVSLFIKNFLSDFQSRGRGTLPKPMSFPGRYISGRCSTR